MKNHKQDDKKAGQRSASRLRKTIDALGSPMPEIGATRREAVWKKNKATLWYYPPLEKKYRVPVFLIYSLINQPFILDLGPGMSMIEAFVDEGFEVYLLDYGVPGFEDGDISIDDYITDYIQKGVQRSLRHSGAEEISVFGFCLGGTLAAIYAAIADEPVKNLILSTTPVDFSHSPGYDQWSEAFREGSASFDEFLDAIQIVPGNFMQTGMRLITSPLYFSHYLSLLANADDPDYVAKWRRFNAWMTGHIPFTGAALKQLMNDLGKNNKLIKGSLYINKRRASLKNIKSDLLVVVADNDNLIPLEMTKPVMDLVSSRDKTFRVVNSGHTTVGRTGGLPDYITEWLPERSVPLHKGIT